MRAWLAARLSSEEGGLSHTGRVEIRARKAGANAAARALLQTGALLPTAREDRTLEVVLARHFMLLQKSTDSAGAEKRTHLHFTRSGSVRGRAPSPPPLLYVRKCAEYAAGEEALAPSSQRKPHVTVPESGCDPRMAREAGDGRHPGSSWWAALHGTLAYTVSAASVDSRFAKANRGPRGGDRDVRGTVEPGVAGRIRRATNPEPPAEADRAS